MRKKILFLFLLFTFRCFFADTIDAKNIKVNIIGHSGGKGLVVDKAVLSDALVALGCDVTILEGNEESAPDSDVNIFLEQILEAFCSSSKLNWFIPNPEWFSVSKEAFSKIDLILCRTKEVERIFTKKKKSTYYLGFTTPEAKIPRIAKNFTKWLHVSGNSPQKGTGVITRTWLRNNQFPHTTIVRWSPSPIKKAKIKNLTWISKRLPLEDIRLLQNESGVHLCLSETEGFGHYLMEAMSCGAVIVTTDAPPMNEFIKDKRCLVPYEHTQIQKLATNYYVGEDDLEIAIRKILSLPQQELVAIGAKNRANYVRMKKEFYIRLKKLMEMTFS